MFILVILIVVIIIFNVQQKKKIKALKLSNEDWKQYLDKVRFYQKLNSEEKVDFQEKVQAFVESTTVKGVDTSVSLEDRVLIGASAIIPVFRFPNFNHYNLTEVLIFAKAFDISQFNSKEFKGRKALGLVGTGGVMRNTMVLSKEALHHGFDNNTDKNNTAIHEFIHLIDGLDGKIDGVPKVLLEEPNVIPWLELMYKKIAQIHKGKSDIRAYGGTNFEEFFSVAAEYFLKDPIC